MKKYIVKNYYHTYTEVEVEANNELEAIKEANKIPITNEEIFENLIEDGCADAEEIE